MSSNPIQAIFARANNTALQPFAPQAAAQQKKPRPAKPLPLEIVDACLLQLDNRELAQLSRRIALSHPSGENPRRKDALSLAVRRVSYLRVIQDPNFGLNQDDVLALLGPKKLRATSGQCSNALIQQHQLLNSRITWRKRIFLSSSEDQRRHLFGMGLSQGKTSPYTMLSHAYTLLTKIDVRDGSALTDSPSKDTGDHGPYPRSTLQSAGRQALLCFSLMTQEAQESVLGLSVHGTALAFLQRPTRALQLFVSARRQHLNLLQSDVGLSGRVAPNFFEWRHPALRRRETFIRPAPQLYLLNLACVASGSGPLIDYLYVCLNDEVGARRLPPTTYRLGPQDAQSFVVKGQHAGLRAAFRNDEGLWRRQPWLAQMNAMLSEREGELMLASEQLKANVSAQRELYGLRAAQNILRPLIDM